MGVIFVLDEAFNIPRLHLVLFGALALSLHAVHTDLFIVLLQSGQILTSLGELSLLHTFSHIPDEQDKEPTR